MNYFSKSIQRKLRLSYLVLVLIATVSGLLSYYQFNKVNTYQSAKNHITTLKYFLAESRESEKRFILSGRKQVAFLEKGQSPDLSSHERFLKEALSTAESLKSSSAITILELNNDMLLLEKQMKLYQKTFDLLVKKYQERGFKDHGMEGEMRGYVHDLQKCVSPEEKVFAYSLRRHEKDFIIRQDLDYKEKLEQTANEFIQFVETASMPHMDESYRWQTAQYIKAYVAQFNKIIQIEQEIGLNEKEGLLGDLNNHIAVLNTNANFLSDQIEAANQRVHRNAVYLLIGSIVSILTIGLLFSILLASRISRPIRNLHAVVQEILSGKFDAIQQLNDFKLKDEIGGLIASFKEMVRGIELKLKEINEKNASLEEKRLEEVERTWLSTSLSELGDIIRDKYDSTEQLLQAFLSQLIVLTEANQGLVMVTAQDPSTHAEYLEVKAAYAYGRKKHIKRKISMGEGLAGQAWLEKDEIYLSDVPSNYVHIGSGLGDARPRNVMIVPIKDADQIVGIIEIASFSPLTGNKRELISQIAGRLGNILASQRMSEENKKLLEESALLLGELRASEEEMKQNMEEMQATQEEANRQRLQLQTELEKTQDIAEIEDQIISKVFDSWALVSKNMKLKECNAEFAMLCGRKDEKPLNTPIAEYFNFPLENWVSDVVDHPNFKLSGYSKPFQTEIISHMGSIQKVSLVLTEISWNGNSYYLLLFNHAPKNGMNSTEWSSNKVLNKLLYN